MTAIVMECIKAENHPNADSLRVYEFSCPQHPSIQIVANLENIYSPGDKATVVVAPSLMKDNVVIKKVNLRGITSDGMALGKTDHNVGTDLTNEYCLNLEETEVFIPWPDIESLFNVRKYITDKRTVIYRAKVKLDGCFYKKTKITMWDGSRKLIPTVKPGEYVMGADANNNLVKSMVLKTFNNGITNDWVEFRGYRTACETSHTSGIFTIRCTPNHLIWSKSKNSYIEAKDIKPGEIVLYGRKPELSLTFTQKQILLGKMLGDATLNSINSSAHIQWSHTEKDKDYINWTITALDKLAKLESKPRISGYGSTMYRARTINSAHIKNVFDSFCVDKKKSVPEWVADELYPLAIAFWYMDDGSLSHTKLQRDRVSFHTNAFSIKDCEILLKGLNKFGINGSILNDGKSKNKIYPSIHIDSDGSEKLFALIAPYIPPCMNRKLPKHYRNHNGFIPETNSFYEPSLCERKIIDIKRISYKSNKYDIETETHNYFANGVLVHNSNAGLQLPTSATNGKKVIAQSRSRIITVDDDNMGFAKWVVERYDYFLKIRERANELGITDHIAVFGEYCGKGIQKRTAISQIDKKIFAVFAIQIGVLDAQLETDPAKISQIVPEDRDVYVIPWEGDDIVMDFSDTDKLQESANTINKMVEYVELCDPWVKDKFGVSGIGEGVVLYPVTNGTLVSKQEYTDLVFKAKGEKHKVVNSKQPAQINPEFVKTIDDFVNLFITENRLEQIAQKVGGIDVKNTGSFLKEFCQDVQKESKAELEDAGLEWRQVAKAINDRARNWWMENVKNPS